MDAARGRAGVDAERAGLLERDPVRVHGVGEAALLADLLEQPGRHAAAEHLVQHGERVAVGVVAAQRHRIPSTTWTCSVGRSTATSAGRCARPSTDRVGRSPAIGLERTGLDELSTTRSCVEVPGRGDDDVARVGSARAWNAAIESRVIALDRLAVPSTSRPERVVGEHASREAGRGRGRRACRRACGSLRGSPGARTSTSSAPQRRRPDDVGEDVERERRAARRARGRRTRCSSWAVKAFMSPPTDSTASAISAAVRSVGALEQQVLEEVAGAELVVGLVARAGADPEADARPNAAPGSDSVTTRSPESSRVRADPLRLGHRTAVTRPPRLRPSPACRRSATRRRVGRRGDRRAAAATVAAATALPAAPRPGPRSPNSLLGLALPVLARTTRPSRSAVAAAAAFPVAAPDPGRAPLAAAGRTARASRPPLARPPSERRRRRSSSSPTRRERELARVVDVVDAHGHLVAEVEHVLDPVDALAADRASRCGAGRHGPGGCSRTHRTW